MIVMWDGVGERVHSGCTGYRRDTCTILAADSSTEDLRPIFSRSFSARSFSPLHFLSVSNVKYLSIPKPH